MAHTAKTAEELKEMILHRSRIKVAVRPHETKRWIANPYALQHHTSADLAELDRLTMKLRNKYVVKNE